MSDSLPGVSRPACKAIRRWLDQKQVGERDIYHAFFLPPARRFW